MWGVMARLDRDGQAGPAQPGDIEGGYAKNSKSPRELDFEITLETVR
jgi:cytochrome c-type biogenesis protein CcmH